MTANEFSVLPKRLFDYLLVVGRQDAAVRTHASPTAIQTPTILRRFPATDHSDFPLPPDVVHFCQPDGCYASSLSAANVRAEKKAFVFCMTEKDSNMRRFGVCLNFFRTVLVKSGRGIGGGALAGRALSDSVLVTRQPTADDGSDMASPNGFRARTGRAHVLTTVCLLSHHVFFSVYKEILATLHRLVKEVGTHLNEADATAGDREECDVWEGLVHYGSGADEDDEPLVGELVKWIERLLLCPAPVPEQISVELELAIMPTLTLAYPGRRRLPLVDLPVHLPLDLLGASCMLEVLMLILLEQKVVFRSRDYNALSMCVLVSVALLFPLEYLFPVIPILPTSMSESKTLLLAPTPYVIGLPASFLNPQQGLLLPQDVFLVDVDSGRIDSPPNVSIPEVPENVAKLLKERLEACTTGIHLSPSPSPRLLRRSVDSTGTQTFPGALRRNKDANATPPHHGNISSSKCRSSATESLGSPVHSDCDVVAMDIRIRTAVVQFLLSPEVIGNYRRYLRTIRLYSRPVVVLQKKTFLLSAKPKASDFLLSFSDTQAFETYAELELNPTTFVHRFINQGLTDVATIGDKAKYFKEKLQVIPYNVYEECAGLIQVMLREDLQSAHVVLAGAGNSSSDGEYSSDSDSPLEISDDDNEEMDDSDSSEVEVTCKRVTVLRRRQRGSSNTSGERGSETRQSSANEAKRSMGSSRRSPQFFRYDETAVQKEALENWDVSPDSGITSPLSNGVSPLRQLKEGDNHKKSPVMLPYLDKALTSIQEDGLLTSPVTAASLTSPATIATATTQNIKHISPDSSLSSTALHSQADRKRGTIDRRPTPLRSKSLSFSTNVDTLTGRVLASSIAEAQRLASAKSQTQTAEYDDALFGGALSQDDLQQERQIVAMESRWSRCLRKYFPSLPEHEAIPVQSEVKSNPDQGNGSSLKRRLSLSSLTSRSSEPSSPLENSSFLVGLVGNVLAGHGVPFFRQRKLDKLMEDENHRRLTVDAIHSAMVVKGGAAEQEMTDVWLTASVYKGVLALMLALWGGVERSWAAGTPESIASAYFSLEILYTHFDGVLEEGKVVKREKETAKRHSSSRLASAKEETALSGNNSEGDTKQEGGRHASTKQERPELVCRERRYMYEDFLAKHRSSMLDKFQFWEVLFGDVVHNEREVMGLNEEPVRLLERFKLLGEDQQNVLEHDEDLTLTSILINMAAFMVALGNSHKSVSTVTRRLIGRAHIGLRFSQTIYSVLGLLQSVKGNAFELWPLFSRQLKKRTFAVHNGDSPDYDMVFVEVTGFFIKVYSVLHSVTKRWFSEDIVQVSFDEETSVLSIWILEDEEDAQPYRFYSKKKGQELYEAIERHINGPLTSEFCGTCGQFPVTYEATRECAVIRISLEGFLCEVDEEAVLWIPISSIRKCFYRGETVILETDAGLEQSEEHRFLTAQAKEIALFMKEVFKAADQTTALND